MSERVIYGKKKKKCNNFREYWEDILFGALSFVSIKSVL